jgi:NAD(P)-dependent dehydrogenase (short-subunit alcohol dehydrogenase family)
MRTIVVTGATSGMGEATAARLRAAGCRVIGVSRSSDDVKADLSVPEDRKRAVAEILEMTGGKIDAYVANAGISRSSGNERKVMALNYFGAIEPVLDLREALARGTSPAVVLVTSWAMLRTFVNAEALEACLAHDEQRALHLVETDPAASGPPSGRPAYATAKAALARKGRELCWQPEWAEAGITINQVCPGLTVTPLVAPEMAMPGGAERMLRASPSPTGRLAQADDMADVISFFAEGRGRYVSGLVIFVDGGLEAKRRPDLPLELLPDDKWT